MKRLFFAAVALSMMATLTASSSCLKRSSRYGLDQGTSFSNEDELTESLRAMEFFAYQECNDAGGAMQSFTIILADANKDNRMKMTQVGPELDGLACPGFSFPSPLFYRAAIYAEEGRINGVRFQSQEGVTDVGLIRGSSELVYFNAREKLRGFYGTQNGSFVTSLGFVSDDPLCFGQAKAEAQEGTASRSTLTSSDEDGSDAGLIVGIVFAVLALVALIVVGGFFLWRRYKGRNLCRKMWRWIRSRECKGRKVAKVTDIEQATDLKVRPTIVSIEPLEAEPKAKQTTTEIHLEEPDCVVS